jgi:hypothetical protein
MGSVIHGASTKALKHMRENPATIAVYWVYCARANHENVAYPTLRGLERDTGWCKSECDEARKWLIEHQALEVVDGYVRPEWRELEPQKRAQRVNFDKTEYYRPTGRLVVDNVIYPMLYVGKSEPSDVEDDEVEQNTDVLQQRTSVDNGHQSTTDVSSHSTELNTSESKLNTTTARGKKRKGGKTTGEHKERKPTPRSELFKKLAEMSFDVKDVEQISARTVTKVNKLEKWLKEHSPGATVDTLTAFYVWYDAKTKGRVSRPRYVDTFEEHFTAFKQIRQAAKNRPPVQMSDYSKWRLEEMGGAIPDAS